MQAGWFYPVAQSWNKLKLWSMRTLGAMFQNSTRFWKFSLGSSASELMHHLCGANTGGTRAAWWLCIMITLSQDTWVPNGSFFNKCIFSTIAGSWNSKLFLHFLAIWLICVYICILEKYCLERPLWGLSNYFGGFLNMHTVNASSPSRNFFHK